MKPKQVTAFRLDADLLDAMEKLQNRDGISFSEQARRALRPWLEAEGVLKGRHGMGSATWLKHLNRVIDEADVLADRLVAFKEGSVKGSRLEELKDIAARLRLWANDAADFVAQARGVADELPEIDWDKQSHPTIRKILEGFLDSRHDLQRLLLAR